MHGRTECRAGPGARLGLHDDADVLPECCEQPAQPFDGESVEPPPAQVREVGLRHAEAVGGSPMRQALPLDPVIQVRILEEQLTVSVVAGRAVCDSPAPTDVDSPLTWNRWLMDRTCRTLCTRRANFPGS